MWDLPGLGIEPVSLAMSGGSLTTQHQESPPINFHTKFLKFCSLVTYGVICVKICHLQNCEVFKFFMKTANSKLMTQNSLDSPKIKAMNRRR